MKSQLSLLVMAVVIASGCAKTQSDDWSNINYERIARDNQRRENDPSYVQPSIVGCVDDDLYNCNPRSIRY